jgi:hypothetical protein
MMPMQIGAARSATKPNSRAKAFNIENLAADRLERRTSQRGGEVIGLGMGTRRSAAIWSMKI